MPKSKSKPKMTKVTKATKVTPKTKTKPKLKATVAPTRLKDKARLLKQKTKPQILVCPETGDEIWITAANVKDVKLALTKGKQPFKAKRKYLVTVTSPTIRKQIYDEAIAALEDLETRVLPEYGGRPWRCVVKVTDPGGNTYSSGASGTGSGKSKSGKQSTPYFCWHGGDLEIAAWPHLVGKMPDPPSFSGYGTSATGTRAPRARVSTVDAGDDAGDAGDDAGDDPEEEEEEEEEEPLELSPETIRRHALQEREYSSIANMAWNERWRVPLPTVTTKWISPLHVIFHTRKSAWENAVQLCKQEVLLDKVMAGYGANGKEIKVKRPTKAASLKAGKIRFERDGLWVVGQDEAWQNQRMIEEQQQGGGGDGGVAATVAAAAKSAQGQDEPEAKRRRRGTGLAYYLECNRKEHRDKRLKEVAAEQKAIGVNRLSEVAAAAPSPATGAISSAEGNDMPQAEITEDVACDGPKSDETDETNASAAACALQIDPAGVESPAQSAVPCPSKETAIEQSQSAPAATSSSAQVNGIPPAESKETVACDAPKADKANETTAIPSALEDTAGLQATPPVISSSNAHGTGSDIPKVESTGKVVHNGLKADEASDTTTALCPSGDTAKVVQSSAQSVSFTLRDADRELRVLWKALSDTERQEWIKSANKQEDGLIRGEGENVNDGQAKTEQVSVPAPDLVAQPKDVGGTRPAGCVSPSCSESGTEGATFVTGSALEDTASLPKIETKPGADKVEPVSGSVVAPSPPPHVNMEQSKVDIQESKLEAVIGGMVTPAEEKDVPAVAIVATKLALDSKALFPLSTHWCLNSDQVRLCHDAGMDHFNQVMATVQARDLERELQDGFDLLRERGKRRYDMELPVFDNPAFRFLSDVKKAPWMPIVREILGKDIALIHKGMFMSLPGADPQEYHQDGPHLSTQYQKPCHAVNVFVPLVDLCMQNGPTEFCLGTHILGQDDYDMDFVETPRVAAGTPIIFDYRLGHRGLGNSSDACRPILYCTYAAAADGKEFRDSVNFSRKRYHRIGDLVSKTPSRDERKRKRELIVEEQRANS